MNRPIDRAFQEFAGPIEEGDSIAGRALLRRAYYAGAMAFNALILATAGDDAKLAELKADIDQHLAEIRP